MKRFIVKLLAFALLLILPFAIYISYMQSLPAQFINSLMGMVSHKVELLRQTETPRIIFVGGSSSPYATDCEYLSQTLDITCINVGAVAYLGLEFYLSMLESEMRPGDIIVIGPEHSMLSANVDYKTVWCAVENNTDLLALVPTSYWAGMAGSYFDYASDKMNLYNTRPYGGVDTYAERVGPLGNIVGERESLLEHGFLANDMIDLGVDTLSENTVDALNRFYRAALMRDVQVILVFAPLDRLAVTTTPADWLALEQHMRERIDMPILGTLPEALMEGRYFYDSNNHLTSEGARLYSEHLAQLLLPVLRG